MSDFAAQFSEETSYLSSRDQKSISAALDFARQSHEGQTRKSGEPYFMHVQAVALELAKMKMDSDSIMAGILHDVPEDTDVTLEQLEQRFGETVAKLVDGVTKLGRVRLRTEEEQQARNLRKMFLAMSEDVRVIIIKLCDRLHNMQTIEYLPRNKQKGIATETLEIYAPLANRIGMAEIKTQLEDLCLKVLHPRIYNEIEKEVFETSAQREEKLTALIALLEQQLAKANIYARVIGRPKHYYSIYLNIHVAHKEEKIANVLDSLGIRIIVEDMQDCYQALGLVHRLWSPIIGRFKDYIAIPKANGYQSLHTGVITDDGDKVEIQIRTEEMDFVAEYGMAAHWKYKEMNLEFDAKVEERMNWIQQLLDWQKEFRTATDFVESLKLDLFEDQIFVFTPKGDVKDMPKDATPVDFAYKVHSELGNRCLGAKVNGRMVPLDHKLESGDIVDILASRKPRGPSRDWLDFVKTSTAKQRIRSWFKKQQHSENVVLGKKKIQQNLYKLHQVKLESIESDLITQIARKMNFQEIDDMWSAVGYGEASPWQIVRKLSDAAGIEFKQGPHQIPMIKGTRTTTAIKGVGDLLVKIAPCCQPIPGDKIKGYITRGRGITVHRAVCKNIKDVVSKEPERVVSLEWAKKDSLDYEIQLLLVARDRSGLIKDVTQSIADHKVNITDLEVHTDRSFGKVNFLLSVQLTSLDQFRKLIQELEAIPDVVSVRRK